MIYMTDKDGRYFYVDRCTPGSCLWYHFRRKAPDSPGVLPCLSLNLCLGRKLIMFCPDQIGPTGESRLVLWWKERLFSLFFFCFF